MPDSAALSGTIDNASPVSEDLMTIARGAGINFVGHLSAIVLIFALNLLLARALGPQGTGVIGIALSVTSIALVLAMFGLQTGVVRFVAFYVGQDDQARATGAILAGARIVIALSLAVAAVLLIATDLLAERVFEMPNLTPVLHIFAVSLPFLAVTQFFLSVTQGLKRMEYRAIIERMVVPGLKIAGLYVVLYLIGRSAVGVAYAFLVAAVLGAILAVVSVAKVYPIHIAKGRAIFVTRAMIAFSWPLLMMDTINQFWLETGILVLGAFAAADQVGIYYVGLRATALITLFMTGFSTIFAPIMAELHAQQNNKRLNSLLKTVTRWGFSLCVPFFLILFIFSKEILQAFGPGFERGSVVLKILAVSQLVNVATGPSGWLLTMSGHTRLNLLNSALMLGLSLGLAFLLIPRFGIVGAAVGAGVSTILVKILRLLEVHILFRIHPFSLSYMKPVAAGLLSLLAVSSLHFLNPDLPPVTQLTVFAPLTILLYVMVLLILKLDKHDWVVVHEIHRQFRRFSSTRAVRR